MLRFVVLTHDHPDWHWDFMLERDGGLQTWRLVESPLTPGVVKAEPLSVHRLEYLEYEGPVSGGRGEVRRWDCGVYKPIEESQYLAVVQLLGEKLQGRAKLETLESGTFFCFTPDQPTP